MELQAIGQVYYAAYRGETPELTRPASAVGRGTSQMEEFQRGLRMPACMATATASVRSPTSSLALMWLM